MVNVTTISIIIPVIVLVVLEISRIGRASQVTQFSISHSWHGLPIPDFNRLFIIHLVNMLIMTISFDFLFGVERVQTVLTIGTMALFVWVILPLLEIESYGEYTTSEGGIFPQSWAVHAFYTIPIPVLQGLRESLLWLSQNYEHPISIVNFLLSLNPLLSIPTILLVYISSIKFFESYSEETDPIARNRTEIQYLG